MSNTCIEYDYIIQNPPYSGSFHLNFLKKGLELLKKTSGKMSIIEPATWLTNIRKNGKASEYDEIKAMLSGHVSKVIIENMNNEFNIGLSNPLSITYIDFSKEFDNIDFYNCGMYVVVNSLYDCNLIGSYTVLSNIFDKVLSYKDMMINHMFDKKDSYDSNVYYAACAKSMRGGIGDPRWSDEWFINNYYRCYYYHCFNDKEPISNKPHKLLKTGSTYKNPVYKDEYALNIVGQQYELENFKNFIFNNKLPLFLNLCIIQDMSPCSISQYIPWLVDKKYTDEEINELFHFTSEEIALMDKTIKKFERNSPWFKRYMCGKDSVSNEEVQKFIDSL